MITAISKINPYMNCQSAKPQNTARLSPMPCDTFEIQKKSSPSFTSANPMKLFPKEEMIKACDETFSKIAELTDSEKIAEILIDFFDNKMTRGFLKCDESFSPSQQNVFGTFRHELVNKYQLQQHLLCNLELKNLLPKFVEGITSDTDYLNFQKSQFKAVTDTVKEGVGKWYSFEKNNWLEPETIVPVEDLVACLKPLIIDVSKVKISGLDLLSGKKVKNPIDLYTICSHPILNAQKYGENKPFEISINKKLKDGKEEFWATFLNPETKPIPDDEIAEILKGESYRAIGANGIVGTGHGYKDIKVLLSKSEYKNVVPNIIKKGREKGVCVRVPLVGVE